MILHMNNKLENFNKIEALTAAYLPVQMFPTNLKIIHEVYSLKYMAEELCMNQNEIVRNMNAKSTHKIHASCQTIIYALLWASSILENELK